MLAAGLLGPAGAQLRHAGLQAQHLGGEEGGL